MNAIAWNRGGEGWLGNFRLLEIKLAIYNYCYYFKGSVKILAVEMKQI